MARHWRHGLPKRDAVKCVLSILSKSGATCRLNAPLLEAEEAASAALGRAKQLFQGSDAPLHQHIEKVREASDGIMTAVKNYGAEILVFGAGQSLIEGEEANEAFPRPCGQTALSCALRGHCRASQSVRIRNVIYEMNCCSSTRVQERTRLSCGRIAEKIVIVKRGRFERWSGHSGRQTLYSRNANQCRAYFRIARVRCMQNDIVAASADDVAPALPYAARLADENEAKFPDCRENVRLRI